MTLPPCRQGSIFGAVLGHALVVFSDAHLGVTPPSVEESLLDFLEAVPTLGDCLLINGDLFDFWYSYGQVIPRRGFRVAAALSRLAGRLPVVMVGGNHDRWGGDFWEREVGVRFHPDRLTFRVGEREVTAIHGDGVAETRRRAVLLHRIINHRVTSAAYRVLHPDLGIPLVDFLSPHLGNHTMDEAKLAEAGRRQQTWAEALLAREPGLGLVIMGHTHRAALVRDERGAEYLNPGAWFDGYRYAVADAKRSELRTFTPR